MKEELEIKSIEQICGLELPNSDDLKQLQNDYYKNIIIENSKKVTSLILTDGKNRARNGYSDIEISSIAYYLHACRIIKNYNEIKKEMINEIINLLKELNYNISYKENTDENPLNIIISWR